LLARAAEDAARSSGLPPPHYVIGTEVPVPGGLHESISSVDVTHREAALRTYRVHQEVFRAAGLTEAFERVVGLVVQPGVEFSNVDIVDYKPDAAQTLSQALLEMPGIVFEAHSTDYQQESALAALVRDGFAILKVGPELTFALREALYALDAIATALDGPQRPALPDIMERLMCEKPGYWRTHLAGDAGELRLLRHYSYSDRIRYYWSDEVARSAVENLMNDLDGRMVPATLVRHHFPRMLGDGASWLTRLDPRALIAERVRDVIRRYASACGG
jgi:D-tagatose-bisphosphate aldolase class II non-catalytic subunit